MTYTITLQIYQTNTNAYFHIVEKTCWKYAVPCVWSEVDGTHVLKMENSGTCGSLRFVSDTGETFIVTVGVHNYKRWCDIAAGLSSDQTGVVITPEYYDDKYPGREAQRERQLVAYGINNPKGRNFSINYSVAEGTNLKANIVIG